MTDNQTAALQDIQAAATDILDAAIAANNAAREARERADQLHSKKTEFEDTWRVRMFTALKEEGPTPNAKRVLHAIIDNLAAAEGLNLNTTEAAQEAIKAVLRSTSKARIEEATTDVAVITLNERTSSQLPAPKEPQVQA